MIIEAYSAPSEANHAVGFAIVGFTIINFPAGMLNVVNPFWEQLTNVGLWLGLEISWAEAFQVIVTNGVLGYFWWFVAAPRVRKFVQS